MANSRYEYVRNRELPDPLLPNAYFVVRIDGRGFHKFSKHYDFAKPNDLNALNLLNAAATAVMRQLPDIVLGYGVSDEYSFLFRRRTELFDRRASKIVTTVVSTFTAAYTFLWPQYFPDRPLVAEMLPTFDGRAVVYCTKKEIRDYFSWRQVDCHINNLYNTTFHALMDKGGMSNTDAEARLSGTVAADKNEILFSQFGINYNNEPEIFKKGNVAFRDLKKLVEGEEQPENLKLEDMNLDKEFSSKNAKAKARRRIQKAEIVVQHVDIIQDYFWNERAPWILADE
ncbi:tRNAHis guanylyltransferase [Ascobolus immersus RN42]|uniref:tRNA(His) guanylyltransferase n=1 Tax=Ascobolus immersus RN42 TaxID=1160509 RepID=A0A3N4IDU3_ASCIM|nr:tRNAHis guanylyltransferase [Ascobolus immersus RN42]